MQRAVPGSFHRRALADRLSTVFVDVPELFDRDGLYGDGDGDYRDNAYRFAVFSRAALEYHPPARRAPLGHPRARLAGRTRARLPEDAVLARPGVGGVPVVFTIHNLAFQGVFPVDTLDQIGAAARKCSISRRWSSTAASATSKPASISASSSPRSARPMRAKSSTPEHGFGFEGILARRAEDLRGILNGIDDTRWNPATDLFVPARYSAADLVRQGEAKRLLLQASGLDAGRRSPPASADRAGLAADGSERVRPHRRRRRRVDGAGCGVGHARKRRSTL